VCIVRYGTGLVVRIIGPSKEGICIDVALCRVADELKQQKPRSEQDKEKGFVGQPAPTIHEVVLKLVKNAGCRLFLHARLVRSYWITDGQEPLK
jgi:hypothetical protein